MRRRFSPTIRRSLVLRSTGTKAQSIRNWSSVSHRPKSPHLFFNYTLGFTITIGASGKAGVPFVAEDEVKVETSNSHTFTWGSETTESKVYETKFSVTAPPNSKMTASATVTRADIDVPFAIYSKSVATGDEVATEGIYKGVTHWNIECDYKQDSLRENSMQKYDVNPCFSTAVLFFLSIFMSVEFY